MSTPGISKSAHKLVPKDPDSSMSIRDVVPGVISTLSTPFLRFGLVKVGGRATIVKLKTGNLAVFSPVALTNEAKAKIEQLSQTGPLGSVRYLVAPDFEHHIYLSPWAKEYPDANVIGPEGLPEKRDKDSDTKGLKFHHVFTKENKSNMTITPEFDDDFNYEYVHAHGNKELVFFHKPTRTLIEADLILNLPATEQFSRSGDDASSGFFQRLVNSIASTKGDMKWQARLIYYGPGSSDRKAFAESIRKIQAWGEFDRLIPCHGDVIERGGSRILAQATAFYRDL